MDKKSQEIHLSRTEYGDAAALRFDLAHGPFTFRSARSCLAARIASIPERNIRDVVP